MRGQHLILAVSCPHSALPMHIAGAIYWYPPFIVRNAPFILRNPPVAMLSLTPTLSPTLSLSHCEHVRAADGDVHRRGAGLSPPHPLSITQTHSHTEGIDYLEKGIQTAMAQGRST